jgi:hypothetical protein
MSDPELTRLRRDMDVIQEAAGLTFPFGWRDVWLILGMVPCGLIILLWGLAGPTDHAFFSTLPLIVLTLVIVGLQISQYRYSGHGSFLKQQWIEGAVAVLAFAVLILWEKWLGLPYRPVRGAAVFIAGAMLFVMSLSSRHRRAALGSAVALIPFGLVVPLCSQQQIITVGGGAVMLAGIVGAGILAAQLRADRSGRE